MTPSERNALRKSMADRATKHQQLFPPNVRFLALDPGAKHCGIAWVDQSEVQWTRTEPPEQFLVSLDTHLYRGITLVVMEEFRLYPWKSDQQAFSTLETVEVIGVVKWICRRRGITLVTQSASVKKPAVGWMRHREVAHLGRTQHEKDAEMHAYYYLWSKNS